VTDHISAVEPNSFLGIHIRAVAGQELIASDDPTAAQYIKGVRPRSSLASTLAPSLSIASSHAKSFARMAA
jgi:hypothetical protein